MGTTLVNQATVNYEYACGSSTAVSNLATTITQDQYSLSGIKYSLENGFRPGSSVTFVIRIENIGSGVIYNPGFVDKLEGVYYRIPTLKLFINSIPVAITPSTVLPWLSANSTTPLYPGDIALFTFVVDVPEDYNSSLSTLTNCININGNQGAPDGTQFVIEDASCLILSMDNFADLSITKSGSPSVVNVGDTLTYTLTLSNSGNLPVTNSVITDTLPPNFSINSISSNRNGIITNYGPTDYAVDGTNTVTIPSATGPLIIVDAAVMGVPGQTIVQIVGTII